MTSQFCSSFINILSPNISGGNDLDLDRQSPNRPTDCITGIFTGIQFSLKKYHSNKYPALYLLFVSA